MPEEYLKQYKNRQFYYDKNPFNRDKIYILPDQKLQGIRDLHKHKIPNLYYDLIMNSIYTDDYMSNAINNSYFLQRYIEEIVNRLCTECDYCIDVEVNPKKYLNTETKDHYAYIYRWIDYAINTCRYGYLNERMVDSVPMKHVETFMYRFIDLCVDRLMVYIIKNKDY